MDVSSCIRLALVQTNPLVGAISKNLDKILRALEELEPRADLAILPELALVGYPPRDLLAYPAYASEEEAALQKLKNWTQNKKIAVLMGHLEAKSVGWAPYWNAASLFEAGQCRGTVRKQRLPLYDIFDEKRFFDPYVERQAPLLWRNLRLGVSICEDNWDDVKAFGEEDWRHYDSSSNPWTQQADADLWINLSASPWSLAKNRRREKSFQEAAKRHQKPIVYVNCVGAQDDILFDGQSFVANSKGELIHKSAAFEEQFSVVNLELASLSEQEESIAAPLSDWALLKKGLCYGIKDFVFKSGFQDVLLGLSGGIDSALTAYLATEALGAEHVLGVSLPFVFTSELSRAQARILAQKLKIEFREVSIENSVAALQKQLELKPRGLAFENLQSRVRGIHLMTLSNQNRALLLATGNKSEMAMGYCTLYGDMCGALAPLADLYKTEVFALAFDEYNHSLKHSLSSCFPLETLTRDPSAELAPGQRDVDSLPHYAQLDVALHRLIEEQGIPAEKYESWSRFLGGMSFKELERRFHLNEFKRYQAPLSLRVHSRSLGRGWQMPLVKEILS